MNIKTLNIDFQQFINKCKVKSILLENSLNQVIMHIHRFIVDKTDK